MKNGVWVAELRRRIELAESNKKKLFDYLQILRKKVLDRELTYFGYEELISEKKGSRTIPEWIEYYNFYIEDCEKRIEQAENRSIRSKILITFFSLFLIAILVFLFFHFRPQIAGLIVEEQVQTYAQTLNLEFNQTSDYNWQPEYSGLLKSLKLSGSIEGSGQVRIYLDDLLILDSAKIKSGETITGRIIEEIPQEVQISIQEPTQENPKITQAETKTQEIQSQQPEETTQQQSEENPEETPADITEQPATETLPEETPTPNEIPAEQPAENITQPVEQPETPAENITIEIREFAELCEETCDLSGFNLSEPSYTIKIEISNAKLKIESIKYDIEKKQVEPEIPENITEIIPGNITEEKPEILKNITIAENITEITAENLTIFTEQLQAKIGQPVKWRKNVKLEKQGIVKIKLPKQAENIDVKKIESNKPEEKKQEETPEIKTKPDEQIEKIEQKIEELQKEVEELKETIKEQKEKTGEEQGIKPTITGQASFTITKNNAEKNGFFSSIKNFFRKISGSITGRAITTQEEAEAIELTIDDTALEYEVEYETPSPSLLEENTTRGKKIIISGIEDLHYENILTFTNIKEVIKTENKDKIKIKWLENNSFVEFNASDTDNNGFIDYIEWVTPYLSSQTFEIIIEISKAEHLDENRTFISDIYEQVKALDGIWSEQIPSSHYVRVTFKQNLTKENDITLFPRVVSGNPKIEVYEADGDDLIAEFTSLNNEEYNKVYLTNLTECYDNKTEILTENGWKYFFELGNEKVATLNNLTGKMEWQKPTEKQVYENNKEMYKITLEDGSDLVVSPEHKVYSAENINLSNKSLVLNTSTLRCFFNAFSSDQIGQLNLSAMARYSLSFSCPSSNSQASGIKEENSCSGINLTLSLKTDNNSENSSSVLCVFDNISSLLLANSSKINSGATNSMLLETNISLDDLLPLINNENSSLASITTSIYLPLLENLFDKASLSFLPNLNASSCVNSLSFEKDSKTLSCTIFFSKASLATSDQFIILNSDSSSLNLSGIDIVKFGILPPDTFNHINTQNTHIYKSFGLKPITEVYRELGNGDNIYFLNSENKAIKIKNITKENYKGKIYDVDVENDIVLVRRCSERACERGIWSGNSNSQDTFDLKIVDGIIEIEHIIDPQYQTLIIDAVTDLCGEVTLYNKIVVNGTLNICPYTTAGTGYVNISLGANGNFTVYGTGIINGNGSGAGGGAGAGGSNYQKAYQGTDGNTLTVGTTSPTANGGGGGGANKSSNADSASGGGGGFGGAGGEGGNGTGTGKNYPGKGGNTYGTPTSLVLLLGSGGGGGAGDAGNVGDGGAGGGGFKVNATSGWIDIQGKINLTGFTGGATTTTADSGSGGGGSGGHLVLIAQNISINNTNIYVKGGMGGNANTGGSDCCGGGGGGGGRIVLLYGTLINTTAAYQLAGGTAGTSGGCDDNPDNGVEGSVSHTSLAFPAIDTTAPSISIIYPGNTTYGSAVTLLNYTVSGNDFHDCWYSNNSGRTNTSITCGNNATGLTSVEGNNIWTIWAEDSSANLNLSIVTFIKDTTKPLVTINLPANTTYNGNGGIIPLNFTLNEAGTCWYSLNAGRFNYTMQNNGNKDFNATNTSIADGSYLVNAYCNDTIGNNNFTATQAFSKDTVAPIVTINLPANTTYSTSSIIFNFTLNEAGSCRYSLNSGRFNYTMQNNGNKDFNETNTSIADGSYLVNAYCNDTAGNNNLTATKEFSKDTTAPLVTINLPENITYNTNSISFNVTLNENGNFCNYTLNNGIKNYTMQNNGNKDFNATNTSIADGSYLVKYYCWDALNNLNNTATKAFSKDTTPPVITINQPQASVTSLPLLFNVTLNEAGTSCLYSINDTTMTNITMQNNGNRDFNATNTSIAEGNYIVYYYCNDTANNWNTTASRGFNVAIPTEISTCSVLDIAGEEYKLTIDIIDDESEICMNISADNVTLNCQGYTIDGLDTGDTYGVYVDRASSTNTNITIKDCNINDWYYGIFLYYSSNNNLNNITANSNTYRGIWIGYSSNNNLNNINANSNTMDGIFLASSSSNNNLNNITANSNTVGVNLNESSNNNLNNINANSNTMDGIFLASSSSNNTLNNITANSNSQYGISLISSSNNTLNNITANSNSQYGISLISSSNNIITDAILTENIRFDLAVNPYTDADCNNKFENITGSGGRAIEYYNSSIILENKTLSGLILCNADYSSLKNITIEGSSSLNNNELYAGKTDYSNLTDINSSNNYYGIDSATSSNNNLTGVTANSNSQYGINLFQSSNNTLNNITANSNDYYGISLTSNSNSNTLTSNTITTSKPQAHGIYLISNSNSNTLTSNTITVSGGYSKGIYLSSSSNNNLNNNNITAPNTHALGIDLETSSNNTLTSNNITTAGDSGHGIYLTSNSDSNTLTSNTITTNGPFGHGIYLTYLNSSYNTLTSNTITTNGTFVYGIGFSSSSNSNITSNTITTSGSSGYGIYLGHNASYNTLTSNTITTNGPFGYGIYLTSNSDSNTLTSNTITTSGSSGYGICFASATSNNIVSNMSIITNNTEANAIFISDTTHNFTISDSILNSSASGVSDFNISTVRGGTWNFTNVTRADGSSINIIWSAGANGTLNMMWHLDANVSNSTNSLEGANVIAWDNSGIQQFSELTGADGRIATRDLLEYTRNSTSGTNYTYYSNHTFNASLAGYTTQTQSWNMTTSRYLIFILSVPVVDTEYPLFSSFWNSTANNTQYYPNLQLVFNATITSTNGTAGIDFNNVNYTATNSTSYFKTLIADKSAGTYDYYYWAYGNGTSHLYNKTETYSWTIAKNQSMVYAYINNTRSYFNATNETINTLVNGTLITGVGNINLTINTTPINYGASPLSNLTNWTIGFYWVNATYSGNENYTSSMDSLLVNITAVAANQLPEITWISNESIAAFAPNEAPASTSVIINFTAYDGDGADNLNDATAAINLTKTNEDTRTNASCEWLADFGNYANYTCNITMWWWDASGTWIVNASISDLSEANSTNDTTTFTVNARTAFAAAPPTLTWAAITAGAVNQTSNTDPVLLNNTGNQNISFGGIQINATDLVGEADNSKALYAGNFSVGNTTTAGTPPAECSPADSNTTRKSIYTPLSKPNLPRGNLTKAYSNETSGQEQLYFCLKLAGTELISQPYSTYLQGSWTIKILLVAVAFGIRKRKRKIKDDKLFKALSLIIDELKERYSLSKAETMNILVKELREKYKLTRQETLELIEAKRENIPVTIFSKQLGCLEALCKYLKENLEMSYHEIAVLLNRNDRTIWTAYNKAIEKQPEKLEIKETEMLLPVSILKDRKLTILESIIVYLKEKDARYSEIAKLLNREQRNIWTIYSRAVKKLGQKI